MALAAISVDLDTLRHYGRIHGLDPSVRGEQGRSAPGPDLVYTLAVPRFLELLAELKLPATFFVIGEDLASRDATIALRDAVDAGVELGNHSYAHDYALSRRSPAEIAEDLSRGAAAIAKATGVTPRGFRAPGYTLSAALYRAVEAQGYLYDSSTFPAAPYWAAKATVMGAMRVFGRRSGALLDSPRVLLAPTRPYFPDPEQPYRRGSGHTLELPITVAPFTGVPFIGTTAVLLPKVALAALYRTVRRTPLLNFELHAIDLLSEDDGVPPALVRSQPDLRIPWTVKRARLRELFGWIRSDFETVTLADAAERAVVSRFRSP